MHSNYRMNHIVVEKVMLTSNLRFHFSTSQSTKTQLQNASQQKLFQDHTGHPVLGMISYSCVREWPVVHTQYMQEGSNEIISYVNCTYLTARRPRLSALPGPLGPSDFMISSSTVPRSSGLADAQALAEILTTTLAIASLRKRDENN